ncbi:hypothetical protein BBP40_002610 [Aspergillus hancockii]|nr:hypothetical protein BBP40_002610 [Aspergillus hancockii]
MSQDGQYGDKNTSGSIYWKRYLNKAVLSALKIVEPVATAHGLSFMETAVRWPHHHSQLNLTEGEGDGIGIGVSSFDQLRSNVDAIHKRPLPEEVIGALDDAWMGVKAVAADYWHLDLAYTYDTRAALFSPPVWSSYSGVLVLIRLTVSTQMASWKHDTQISPQTFPNDPIFTRIRRFSAERPGEVFHDEYGTNASYNTLISDVMHSRHVLQEQLSSGSLNEKGLSGYNFTMSFLAIAALGGICVPLVTTGLLPGEALHFLNKCNASCVLAEARTFDKAVEIRDHARTQAA